MKTIGFTAKGRVQGVGFRFFTRSQARKFGIRGWVRNKGYNYVEGVIQGDINSVEKMTEWLKKGPLFARVENIVFDDIDNESGKIRKYDSFEVRDSVG